ncbi:MAG: 50S ribosomal protein L3 [Oligoflexia bacterium]|nr:50S ribosomal protein L3 [Oligoflexia bacterium]
MSEAKTENQAAETQQGGGKVQLPGLFAFKVGMTRIPDDKGEMVTCTVLKYEPWVVSQVKTGDKDGYSAIQIACRPKTEKRSTRSELGHLKGSLKKSGAYFVRELAVDAKDGASVGVEVDLASLKKGDWVKATAVSKGKGFQGSVKRFNVGGGPAAHGSCFHRQPGSSGNRTWPGRIMKGKPFPGHMGDEKVTIKNLKVLDVLSEDNVILVSGSVPGAKNALVRILKQD